MEKPDSAIRSALRILRRWISGGNIQVYDARIEKRRSGSSDCFQVWGWVSVLIW